MTVCHCSIASSWACLAEPPPGVVALTGNPRREAAIGRSGGAVTIPFDLPYGRANPEPGYAATTMIHRHTFLALALGAGAALASSCSCPPCVSVPPAGAPVARGNDAEAAPDPRYFDDPSRPVEERIDDLLAHLRLEDKIDMLSTDPSLPRLGVVGSDHVEGLHGLAMGGPGGWGQHRPIFTTMFPQAIGLGNTWDPDLVRRAAAVEGNEARYIFHVKKRGGLVIRAPNADLARDPRWGRNEESYGEDPFLASTLAVAFVRGLQGDHPKYWQAAALLKHFLANNNEAGRAHTSSDFDERLFHEYYAVAFREAIVRGGARAFMAAYNAYNGVPCTTHPMLERIAVERWGQDEIICTDAGALKNLVTEHKQFDEPSLAAAASVKAGISQFLDRYRVPVRQALRQGLLSEAEIDQVIRKNFRVMIHLGLLDPVEDVPYTKVDPAKVPWESQEHKDLARLVTQKSIVLLKNSQNALPLDPAKLESLAVIGPHADQVHLDWYSGTPPYSVSPLAGISARVGDGVRVSHASGEDRAAAARLAKALDVAILVVGNHPTGDAGWAKVKLPSYGKEAVDRQSITLEDEALIQQVYRANSRCIVVLLASFPYAINWTSEHVPAIVHLTHSSQELGNALADVLFGDINPGGRLVQTWPRSIDDLPPMMDYDIRHGRTYLYSQKSPLYAFGYGLSYTTFGYSNLMAPARLHKNESTKLVFELENTGSRLGDEVTQLYVRWLDSKVERPERALKAFQRVTLPAGDRRRVALTLAAKDLAYWDAEENDFIVETGKVEVGVGGSSDGIRLTKTIEIVD